MIENDKFFTEFEAFCVVNFVNYSKPYSWRPRYVMARFRLEA